MGGLSLLNTVPPTGSPGGPTVTLSALICPSGIFRRGKLRWTVSFTVYPHNSGPAWPSEVTDLDGPHPRPSLGLPLPTILSLQGRLSQ